MGALASPYTYLIWHYTLALRQIASIWIGFMWYLYNLFSIPLLLRTLLAPWKRMTEPVGGGLEKIAEAVMVNMLSRIVGLMIRLPIIFTGCSALLLGLAGLVLVYVLWIFLPLIILTLFTTGIGLLYV